MKLNIDGMVVECTVEEFKQIAQLFGANKETATDPLEQLQQLKGWEVVELESEHFGGYTEYTAKVVYTGKNETKKKKTSIEAMGEFWKAKRGLD